MGGTEMTEKTGSSQCGEVCIGVIVEPAGGCSDGAECDGSTRPAVFAGLPPLVELDSEVALCRYVKLSQLVSFLRNLPAGSSVCVSAEPPKRWLVEFSGQKQQQHRLAVGKEAFNVVDFACVGAPPKVERLLSMLEEPLALQPDACVTVNARMVSLPEISVRLVESSGYWHATAMNPHNWKFSSTFLSAAVDAINKSEHRSERHVRDAILQQVAFDTRGFLQSALGGIATASLFLVGDRWYTQSGLLRAFPLLAVQTEWKRLFAASSESTTFLTLNVCRVRAELFVSTFVPATSLVDSLLLRCGLDDDHNDGDHKAVTAPSTVVVRGVGSVSVGSFSV
ncbi:Hypothetical protein UVM_LOCUS459 [uncultured virus]|nr:Hypothetical protein UVM_LOCUS459 [uncultured virus]